MMPSEETERPEQQISEPAAPAEPELVDEQAEAAPDTEGVSVEPVDSGDSAVESAPAEVAESAAPEESAAPAQSAAPEPPALVKPGMHWYVLRVASNKEDQVREALDRKIKIEQLEDCVGRVLVPTQREKRMRGGNARVYHRKLYPGYVFVEMATDDDGRIPENVWFVIKETTGVGDFIGSGGKPSPMPMTDVERMLAASVRPDESPALANLGFKPGDRVKVTEGPFENFEGAVDEINTQKGTVRVIVSIFGRPTPIEIEYWQLEVL